jgi:hypothetical protein
MKGISILFLFLLQFCSKTENTDAVLPKSDSIIGKWQLIETCFSPGNACELQNVENGHIIEFKENGEYLVTNLKEIDSNYLCGGQWKFIELQTNPSEKRLQLSPNCNKALWTFYFNFNPDNTLNINPPCIEACVYTYKAIT